MSTKYHVVNADIVDQAREERACIEGFVGANVEAAIRVFQWNLSISIIGDFCAVHIEGSV